MLKLNDLFKVKDNVEFRINGWSGKYKIENNKLMYNEFDNWKESCSQINYLSNAEIEIISKQILTDEEKEYLKAVIKPFKDRIAHIVREFYVIRIIEKSDENIYSLINISVVKEMPFKNMKIMMLYTLADLGLEE